MMISNNFGLIFLIGIGAYYALVAGFILFSPRYRQGVSRWLLVFLIASGAWALNFTVQPLWLQERLVGYAILWLALTFFYLSYTFLHQDESDRRWWLILLVVSLLLLGLDVLLPAPTRPWLFWQTVSPWWWGVLFVVWGVVMGGTAVLIQRAYNQTERRPLHRNRLRYWLLIAVLLGIGDLFFFLHIPVLAHILRALAATLAVYATVTYRLVDLRATMRRSIGRFLAVILTGFLYVIIFLWLNRQTMLRSAYHPALLGGSLVTVLVIFFHPMQQGLQRLVERLTAEIDYDPNRTLREYSLTISTIVDLSQLEATVVSLISEAMEITYGTLFLVDVGEDVIGRDVYQLISVQGFGTEKLELGSFEANSPVAAFLAQEHRPLPQYDIDLLPQFEETTEMEKEWLFGLGVEVYVPIYSKGKWIGLLGLGPKMSGSRYYERDLLLLSTLADQTAVALENARLVADLVRLNHDVKQAYEDLALANQQLQESYQLKSEFIGMITHELRTPFANIGFSLRLLQQYGLDNLTPAQQEEWVKLQQGINVAREMVENLVKFAAFVNKQGVLRYAEFDFRTLVVEVIRPLQTLAENKGITLHVNGAAEHLYVHADRERLSDAVHHLVHNAIKFTDTDGTIRIRAWQQHDRLRFEIQDTGIGIPAEKLPTLWDGFAQMADPVKRSAEGVGLGLTLVKYIVSAHNGDVYANSEEKVGSVFGFAIPLKQ
ncbi:MAG: hypothetical protein H6660_11615 [Ardenticatenaceae bacterium]|nr:hypothetical protein [Ardenticatenaceae bacterium]